MSENTYDDWSDTDLLDEVEAEGVGLTPWEMDFVESMQGLVVDGAELSDEQRDKLLQIAKERLP